MSSATGIFTGFPPPYHSADWGWSSTWWSKTVGLGRRDLSTTAFICTAFAIAAFSCVHSTSVGYCRPGTATSKNSSNFFTLSSFVGCWTLHHLWLWRFISWPSGNLDIPRGREAEIFSKFPEGSVRTHGCSLEVWPSPWWWYRFHQWFRTGIICESMSLELPRPCGFCFDWKCGWVSGPWSKFTNFCIQMLACFKSRRSVLLRWKYDEEFRLQWEKGRMLGKDEKFFQMLLKSQTYSAQNRHSLADFLAKSFATFLAEAW